jgi:hypothetical protein
VKNKPIRLYPTGFSKFHQRNYVEKQRISKKEQVRMIKMKQATNIEGSS